MHFESWKWTGKQILREFWIHLLAMRCPQI